MDLEVTRDEASEAKRVGSSKRDSSNVKDLKSSKPYRTSSGGNFRLVKTRLPTLNVKNNLYSHTL